MEAFWGEQRLSGCLSAPGGRTFFIWSRPTLSTHLAFERSSDVRAEEIQCVKWKALMKGRYDNACASFSFQLKKGTRMSVAN
jgi:hypothetical protein